MKFEVQEIMVDMTTLNPLQRALVRVHIFCFSCLESLSRRFKRAIDNDYPPKVPVSFFPEEKPPFLIDALTDTKNNSLSNRLRFSNREVIKFIHTDLIS